MKSKRRPWKAWLVLAIMLASGMIISLQLDSFYLGLAVTTASALLVGGVAEFALRPVRPFDRILGALVGGLVGFVVGRLIGAQLLLPILLLGGALLLNAMPAMPTRDQEMPRLPGLPA